MTQYVICGETGDGSDFQYDLRFGPFEIEADALALSTRLNQAATTMFTMDRLPEARRSENHAFMTEVALSVLKSLDPKAVAGVRYKVLPVDPFVEPTESAPANDVEDVFRRIRDLTP